MVVKKSQAVLGHDGEQLHVRGPQMEMRVWENVPRGYHFGVLPATVREMSLRTLYDACWGTLTQNRAYRP